MGKSTALTPVGKIIYIIAGIYDFILGAAIFLTYDFFKDLLNLPEVIIPVYLWLVAFFLLGIGLFLVNIGRSEDFERRDKQIGYFSASIRIFFALEVGLLILLGNINYTGLILLSVTDFVTGIALVYANLRA